MPCILSHPIPVTVMSDLSVSQETSLRFRISAADVSAFVRLSGDDNPLHLDARYARRRGFAGTVVHGGLIIAQVSRLLGTVLPGPGCVWHSLAIRFRAPLYIDEPAVLRAVVTYENIELGVMRLALGVRAGGRRIADGEAQASLARPGVAA